MRTRVELIIEGPPQGLREIVRISSLAPYQQALLRLSRTPLRLRRMFALLIIPLPIRMLQLVLLRPMQGVQENGSGL